MQDSNENDSSEENRGIYHSEEENNHKTNLLLATLLKKIDHQNQRISELTESYAAASKASTPTRKSTSCSRQKEVPLQVRVSLSSYELNVGSYHMQSFCTLPERNTTHLCHANRRRRQFHQVENWRWVSYSYIAIYA